MNFLATLSSSAFHLFVSKVSVGSVGSVWLSCRSCRSVADRVDRVSVGLDLHLRQVWRSLHKCLIVLMVLIAHLFANRSEIIKTRLKSLN